MILSELNKTFPNMPNLRVRSIRVDKPLNLVSCTVSYPGLSKLDKTVRDDIRAVVRTCIPAGYKQDIQLVEDRFTEVSFRSFLTDHFKKNYPLFANIKGENLFVSVSDLTVKVIFNVSEATKRNMEVSELLEKLSDFFRTYTAYSVTFSITVDPNQGIKQSDIDQQERLVQLAINRELLKPQRFFNVTNVTRHLGKLITVRPMYISDIRKPMDSCVVCGKLSQKETRASKNNPLWEICKFNLTDDSGATIPCVNFIKYEIADFDTVKQSNVDKSDAEIKTICQKRSLANDRRKKMLLFLENDQELLVRGKVVHNNFSQRLELQVYDINKCQIEPLNRQPQFRREPPADYTMLSPQRIEEFRQLTFTQTREKHSYLTGKDVVVLSANITGYNVTKDAIFGIAAVRLSNGHLKEKVFTWITPEVTLTDAQMNAAGVNVKQLMACPTVTELIGDLVKFFGDSILIGTDLERLLPMLNYYAAPLGYNFSNETLQQTAVLSRMFDDSSYSGKPNCAMLTDVSKALKMPVKFSGSCEDVATATARFLANLADHAR